MRTWTYSLIGFILIVSLALLINIYTLDCSKEELVIEVFFTSFICIATWSGSYFIDRYICERISDWHKAPVRRLLLSYFLSGSYAILLIITAFRVREWLDPAVVIETQKYIFYSVFSLLITLLVISNYAISDFMKQWQASELKAEHMKQQMLQSEYESLKNQVNPHFLFNSLNTLTALIGEDPEKATDFVQKLSRVFRYALQNQEKTTITLGSELEIVRAYLFIQKMRFGDNLQFEIAIPESGMHTEVITQGLLTLVENAIKHNEASDENPLTIRIALEDNKYIVVSNNLQRKNMTQPSTGIGLPNIISRCESLTDVPVVILEEQNQFIVKLPAIVSKR
ncbi:MAG: histidine kinase [Chitinophagales bacterium]|nr:histidine kinase [Chitinophagales bacterium]